MAPRKPVEIHLGRTVEVSLLSDDGTRRCAQITSAKARGLLALLACAPDGLRDRKWLQRTLWSDRSDQQASGSLRQEMRNLIKTAPELSEVFVSTRSHIQLDLLQVGIAEGSDAAPFLAELVIRDPAFGAWLNQERASRKPDTVAYLPAVQRPMARQRIICFKTPTHASEQTSFLAETLGHFLSRGLRDSMHVDIVDEAYALGRDDVTWIEIQSAPKSSGTVIVRVCVRDGPRKLLIWSDIGELPSDLILEIGNAELLAFCNRIVRGVLDELCLRAAQDEGVGEAAMMGHLSIRKLFSMKPAQMREADTLFDVANQTMPHGVFLAWRAILRSFQRIERHAGHDPEQLAAETVALGQAAVQQDPNNSLVLALVSNALVALGEDVHRCEAMASHSADLNPANPFAWDSLSIVGLYAQNFERAHQLAIRAANISRGAHHSFWWATGLAVSATSLGQRDLAIRQAERAHAQSPDFRPPLRYLTALYAHTEQEEKALQSAAALKKLEPSFSIERLIEDRDYPAAMLRVGGLLDESRLRALT